MRLSHEPLGAHIPILSPSFFTSPMETGIYITIG